MISGGSKNVHLAREDGGGEWCEPLKENMDEFFEEIDPLIIS